MEFHHGQPDGFSDCQGRRSPMHGIPVVIKDNLDTADMPTSAGSFLLKNSFPPDDAFLVKQLKDAGAVILAKLNLSEFASGGSTNSIGGEIGNPHSLTRSPAGSRLCVRATAARYSVADSYPSIA